MGELEGRRALVTGGTRGIGAAIARHLDRAGARVVVAARSHSEYDGPGHFIAADVSTANGPRQLAAGRAGTADDVAALVTFLVSPSASYLTGTNHIIDGGLLPTV